MLDLNIHKSSGDLIILRGPIETLTPGDPQPVGAGECHLYLYDWDKIAKILARVGDGESVVQLNRVSGFVQGENFTFRDSNNTVVFDRTIQSIDPLLKTITLSSPVTGKTIPPGNVAGTLAHARVDMNTAFGTPDINDRYNYGFHGSLPDEDTGFAVGDKMRGEFNLVSTNGTVIVVTRRVIVVEP